jgi:hypothetical protein
MINEQGYKTWTTDDAPEEIWFIEANGRQGLWDWEVPDQFKVLFPGS